MASVFKDGDPLLADLHRLLTLTGASEEDARRIVRTVAATEDVKGVSNLLHARKRKRAWVAMINGYVHHLPNGALLTESPEKPVWLRRSQSRMFDGGGGLRYRYWTFSGPEGEAFKYAPFYGRTLRVEDGSQVALGEALTEGLIHPGDTLQILGQRAAVSQAAGRLTAMTKLSPEDAELVLTPLFKVITIIEAHDLPGRLPAGTVVSYERFITHNEELADKAYVSTGRPLFSDITDVLALADNDGVLPAKF
jgi:hypothetical protein